MEFGLKTHKQLNEEIYCDWAWPRVLSRAEDRTVTVWTGDKFKLSSAAVSVLKSVSGLSCFFSTWIRSDTFCVKVLLQSVQPNNTRSSLGRCDSRWRSRFLFRLHWNGQISHWSFFTPERTKSFHLSWQLSKTKIWKTMNPVQWTVVLLCSTLQGAGHLDSGLIT